MAVLTQGVLGPFTGKVGGVVGAMWKGINYAKGYAIPANPRTVAQTVQRTKFKTVQALAAQLLGTLIATFWNPFAIKMSGYNYFIQQYILTSSSAGLPTVNSVITKGNLEPVTLSNIAFNPSTHFATGNIDGTIQGNGLSTDYVNLLILDKTNSTVVRYIVNGYTREDYTFSILLPEFSNINNLIFYSWASRGSGSTFMVSNSFGIPAV